ncbi:TPA: hypothetical protein ACRVO9_000506, partial [Staphylococcus aureus]
TTDDLLSSGSLSLDTANVYFKIGILISEEMYFFIVVRQLAHYCKLSFSQLMCWGPANLLCP